jgi:hypothetical protein
MTWDNANVGKRKTLKDIATVHTTQPLQSNPYAKNVQISYRNFDTHLDVF